MPNATPDITHDVRHDFSDDCGELIIRQRQEITDEFLQELSSERLAKKHMKHSEMNRVASVPALVWDLWIKEGRDPYQASAKQIVRWLERDNLSAFVTARV